VCQSVKVWFFYRFCLDGKIVCNKTSKEIVNDKIAKVIDE